MNLMEPIFLSLFANIIRMYAIYRCMEHFFLSKDENKISKICMYTGFVLVNSVGYYLFNNMFINISTNIIGLLFITTLYKSLRKESKVVQTKKQYGDFSLTALSFASISIFSG